METGENTGTTTYYYPLEPHKPVRPMVVLKDPDGKSWLCDRGTNPKGDLKAQGCWQCGGPEMAFSRND